MQDEILNQQTANKNKFVNAINDIKQNIENRKTLLKQIAESESVSKKQNNKITKLDNKTERINNNINNAISYYNNEIERSENKCNDDIEKINKKTRDEIDRLEKKCRDEIERLEKQNKDYRIFCMNKIEDQEKKLELLTNEIEQQKEIIDNTFIDEEADKPLVKMKLQLKDMETELVERDNTIANILSRIQRNKENQEREDKILKMNMELTKQRLEKEKKEEEDFYADKPIKEEKPYVPTEEEILNKKKKKEIFIKNLKELETFFSINNREEIFDNLTDAQQKKYDKLLTKEQKGQFLDDLGTKSKKPKRY